jgi:hypothetical protein
MSFKFVHSVDNKYVQYRYMGTATTGTPNPFLDTANWEKQGAEVTVAQNSQAGGGNLKIGNNEVATINNIFNINTYQDKSDAYSGRNAARSQIPTNIRALGMIITYLRSTGWVVEQYLGSGFTDTDFYNNSNWNEIITVKGYDFIGVANPTTTPISVNKKIYYLSSIAGSYTNFSNIEVLENEVAILMFDGANWNKQSIIGGYIKHSETLLNSTGSQVRLGIQSKVKCKIKLLAKSAEVAIYIQDTDNHERLDGGYLTVIGKTYYFEYNGVPRNISIMNTANGSFSIEETYECGYKAPTTLVQELVEIELGDVRKMNIVSVKKDGTGDFTDIQSAINSINDASPTNQYMIQVYDDYYIDDLTKLWLVNSPTQHSTDTPNMACAFIITKDYVHLQGMGGKRMVYVESPNLNMGGSCFQHIQPIFLMGNCKVQNFVFKVKGGRYAIHQDMSVVVDGPDAYKTTVLENVEAIHYGNNMYANGSGWTTTCAQANGIADGQTFIFKNVTWNTYQGGCAFYYHTNKGFKNPTRAIFTDCQCYNENYNKKPGQVAMGMTGSQNFLSNEVEIRNCCFPKFTGIIGSVGFLDDSTTAPHVRTEKKISVNNYIGAGNKPMMIFTGTLNVMKFTTVSRGKKIEVVGGTAKEDLFGEAYRENCGDNIFGVCVGSNLIADGTATKVYSLPYILGNCASNPKTLVVRVSDYDGSNPTEHTITFEQNYMTADGSDYDYNTTPNISQSEIVSTINSSFSSVFAISLTDNFVDSFIDCKEKISNGNQTISAANAMVKDFPSGYNCWRRAGVGDKPDGFAITDIGRNGQGWVLLADKNIFSAYFLGVNIPAVGTLYKVGQYGELVVTQNQSEAVAVAVDTNAIVVL